MNRYTKGILYTVIVLFSGILLSGCTPSQETLSKYDQLVSEANTFWEAKEYSSAVNKFSEATSLVPSKVDAYKGIVSIFATKNRLDDAKKIVDESANKLSVNDRASLYVIIGDAYYSQGEYDKALSAYELAQGIGEDVLKTQAGMGRVYLQKGDIEKAKGYLNKDFNDDLKIEVALINSFIGSVDEKDGKTKAADAIKGITPDEEWKAAYESWNNTLNSLNDDQLFNLAKLSKEYINNGYPYLAIYVLEPKKANLTEYVDGAYLLGKAYYDHKEYQKSIDVLAGMTSLSEKNQYIYWTVARDYYMLNDVNNALDYYDRAISYAGDDAQEKLFQEYIDLLFENEQLTKAQEVLRKAEKIFTQQWVNLYYLKLSYFNEEKEKVKYYSEKIKVDELEGEFKKEYFYWKSRVAIENNLLDEAKRNLDLFFAIDKFDPRYNLLMGQLYFQEGKLDESRNYLKKAIEYDTERIVTDDAQKLLAQMD